MEDANLPRDGDEHSPRLLFPQWDEATDTHIKQAVRKARDSLEIEYKEKSQELDDEVELKKKFLEQHFVHRLQDMDKQYCAKVAAFPDKRRE